MSYFGIPIRNGLPIGLGSVAPLASGGGSPFSPLSLFSGGAPGVWYDPSDLTTLFQDSAGTTPVTAVEQPVGRMLDKSGYGNHAFQATSASRPVLSSRYNLLTKTEQFDDAAWSGANTTVVANTSGTTDPIGGNTADLLYPATTGNFRDRAQQVSSGASGIYTVSEYAKAGGFRWAYFRNLAANNYAAHFDLQTGTLGTVQAGVTATITPAGNGWYRCTITNTSPSATPWCAMGMSDVDNSATATVSGTNGIYVWGASTVPANQSTLPYQRVNTSTDYNTTGFLPYLRFDGVDDSLSTNSISFTATDKMSVFAGVRKLSDASEGCVAELSTNWSSSNGTFFLAAPGGLLVDFTFVSKGTSFAAADHTALAPVTAVVTGIGDISGDICQIRTNGVLRETTTTNQGTGNYGNYPLYIGRRNNATVPFNGQMYSLIIVGKAVTAGELSSSEAYVNQKTGAY